MPELFRALELAHYAARFRGQTFVAGITADIPFQNLLLDLKVLAGYRIRVVLVLPGPARQLGEMIARFNKRGSNFHLLPLLDNAGGHGGSTLNAELGPEIEALLARETVPVLAFQSAEHPPDEAPDGVQITFLLAAQAAQMLGAGKLFLAGAQLADLISASPQAHVLSQEIEALRNRLSSGLSRRFGALLEFIEEQLEQGIPDIILIDDRPGQLFQEVFTHEGAGILFDKVEREIVRQARVEDVTQIGLLLRAEIEEGRILPVDEDAIERDIALYWVYEIDGLIVGSARLKTFDDWAELAQFTTLPRYRGKGHARTLGTRLEEEAAAMGMRNIFALSIYDGMWRFLETQGFSPVERTALPREWQAGYDLNRPSRAYLKEL
jgi:N-acetylglutamate synthase-like GNAT family acetyltransferase